MFTTQCWTKFHQYCYVFSKIGEFVLLNYALCSYGQSFLEKIKKRPTLKLEELRNGQCLEIGNFKETPMLIMITVSYNRLLRVLSSALRPVPPTPPPVRRAAATVSRLGQSHIKTWHRNIE